MTAVQSRTHRSAMSYRAGEAAEAAVRRDYERRGFHLAAQRWRGPGGEIDLIFRQAGEVVFVEVKKSRSFEQAAARVNLTQMRRIHASAGSFLSGEPAGSLTQSRFDVALVDGAGAVQIIENAFGLG